MKRIMILASIVALIVALSAPMAMADGATPAYHEGGCTVSDFVPGQGGVVIWNGQLPEGAQAQDATYAACGTYLTHTPGHDGYGGQGAKVAKGK